MGISFGKFASPGIIKTLRRVSSERLVAPVSAMIPTKIRRSQRLVERCPKENVAPPFSALGNLNRLPAEIQFKIFEHLALPALGMVSICSKALRDQVLTYVCLHSTIQKRFPDRKLIHCQVASSAEFNARLTEIAAKLGFLMKRLTCLFPTKTRIQLVIETVLPQLDCNRPSNHCNRGAECEAPALLGVFLQALSAGWVPIELSVVLRSLSDTPMGSAGGQWRSVLGPPATQQAVREGKLHWRRFHREVYLDPSTTHAGEVSWLTAILEMLEPELHSRAIFTLYGPCDNGVLLMQEMYTTPLLCPVQARGAFLELSRVFTIMVKYGEGTYTKAYLVALIEDMISRPQRWLPLNVAQLFFCCRKDLVLDVLANMLAEGKVKRVGQILAMMTLANLLASENVNWMLEIVELILPIIRNRFQLRALYRHINDAFEAEAMALFEMVFDEDGRQMDLCRNFLRGITLFQIGITQLAAFKALI